MRSLYVILAQKPIRAVVAQVMEDVSEESRYQLRQLFGEDAFYDTLEDVLKDYQQTMKSEQR